MPLRVLKKGVMMPFPRTAAEWAQPSRGRVPEPEIIIERIVTADL